jgi:hypothetical protein
VVVGEVVSDLLEGGPHVLPQQSPEPLVGHVWVHQLAQRLDRTLRAGKKCVREAHRTRERQDKERSRQAEVLTADTSAEWEVAADWKWASRACHDSAKSGRALSVGK